MRHSFIFIYYLFTIISHSSHYKNKVVMGRRSRDTKNTKLNSKCYLALGLGLRSLVAKIKKGKHENVRTGPERLRSPTLCLIEAPSGVGRCPKSYTGSVAEQGRFRLSSPGTQRLAL